MFKACTLLAIVQRADGTQGVFRVLNNADTQVELNNVFSCAAENLINNRTPVEFDGKYTIGPDDMEYLTIHDFALPEDICQAIKNPHGLEIYAPIEGKDEFPVIKALFMGSVETRDGKDIFRVAFQKFKPNQYLTSAQHHLFYSNDTFMSDKRIGITVSHSVDCVFDDGALMFLSYYYARQILDLSSYYREASEQDVYNFVTGKNVAMEAPDAFVAQANTWERRKIASIMDSGVVDNFLPKIIKKRAANVGIDVIVKDGKLILPTDKRERRLVLSFLDEEVYKGVFSQTLYQTNSKRKAK